MKEYRISLENFDLEGFIETLVDFEEDQFVDPFSSVYVVGRLGDQPVAIDLSRSSVFEQMAREGKLVFFSFTAPSVDRFVECMDGGVYESLPETGNELEDLRNRFYPSNLHYVGYLMGIDNGQLVVNSALFFAGTFINDPEITLLSHAGILEEPLAAFITEFAD
jgi:hypothetical protein